MNDLEVKFQQAVLEIQRLRNENEYLKRELARYTSLTLQVSIVEYHHDIILNRGSTSEDDTKCQLLTNRA